MKKKVLLSLLLIVGLLTIVGCGSKKEDNLSETEKQMERLLEINEDLKELDSKVFGKVSHYSEYGFYDIDEVLLNAKKYYDKVIENKKDVDNLGIYNFIEIYDRIVDKATIVYNKIMEEKPVANQKLPYRAEISYYREYQNEFYMKIWEIYMNKN